MQESLGHIQVETGSALAAAQEKIDLLKAEEQADDVINESLFSKVYSSQEIKNDIDSVKELEKRSVEKLNNNPDKESIIESRKKSEILKYIIFDLGKDPANWFGDNANPVKTNKYDSLKTGIEVVVEMEEKDNIERPSHLGLAFDVISTAPQAILTKPEVMRKFSMIREGIKSGKLAEVKYFSSSNRGPHRLQGLPEVVINVPPKLVNQLIELWANNEYETLASHEVNPMIIQQVTAQLKAQIEYANSLEQRDASNQIQEVLNQWQSLAIEKDATLPPKMEKELTAIYKTILEY